MADTREFTATTPLGDDLLFARMDGVDRISQCFSFDLELLSEDTEIAAEDLLGKDITVTLGEGVRYFHGFVNTFEAGREDDGFRHYRVTLVPWLWFLSCRTDCRIFQNMSVVDIIEAVFGDYPDADFEKRLQGSYEARDYCVQYDESDLDFVQRLCEHEGIFYFFEYKDGAHTLILTDANAELKPVPDFETVDYQADSTPTAADRDFITNWVRRAQVTSGKYSHADFDFTKPSADLMSVSDQPMGHAQDAGEVYSHPGSHLVLARGDAIAAIRREELQAVAKRIDVRGNVRVLASGAKFDLAEHPIDAENASYFVIQTRYRMWDSQYRSGGGPEGSAEGFEIAMEVAPFDLPYRPPRTTRRPIMRGPQTATVVGPAGEEIYTDEYSRVKVQFHWDRLGEDDENSSCWVRVSSVWAGSGWGFIQIPRIGHEVIVDFIEGDPDKPIITGRVYNAENMPPYELPGNATQSGWKSNSSLGGGGFNELRFEDKKGSEEVYFQAEKDHTELVKNDETRLIQHDMTERVDNISKQSIGVDRFEEVENNKETKVFNNRTVHIGNNDDETVDVNRSLTVGGNETIHVVGTSKEDIDMNHLQTVGLGQKVLVKAGRIDQVGLAENRTVGGAHVQTVGLYRDIRVGSHQKHYVQAADKYEVKGNQTTKLHADHLIDVGGNQTIQTGGGRLIKVGKGQTHDVAEDVWIKAGKAMMLEAADSITLKCGDASVTLKKDGTITVDGKDLKLEGSGKIDIKASKDITMKGSKINQN